MRATITVLCLAILLATFTACEREDEAGEEEMAVPAIQTMKSPAWTDALAAFLPALGHRNWIVVADSAFPLQISPGIETIVSNEDHFTVLANFLKSSTEEIIGKLAWPIHESRRLQMRGAEGEAVLILVKKRVLGLRTLRNKADAAGSARPEGKNAGSFETKLGKPNRK